MGVRRLWFDSGWDTGWSRKGETVAGEEQSEIQTPWEKRVQCRARAPDSVQGSWRGEGDGEAGVRKEGTCSWRGQGESSRQRWAWQVGLAGA